MVAKQPSPWVINTGRLVMISLELNFQGCLYYGIGLSDQDFIIGVYHWISDQCHIGFYQTSPALDQWQWIWPFPTCYIYIYIYGPGLVSISDMMLSYKFSKAWGLYFIWSLRVLTCVSAAMLLDSIEPSWQPETRVKFSSKTISHLRDFMGSGIFSSWQGNMSGCVDVSHYASGSLKWRQQKLNRPTMAWTAKRNAYVNYITINWNGNFWILVLIFTKWD